MNIRKQITNYKKKLIMESTSENTEPQEDYNKNQNPESVNSEPAPEDGPETDKYLELEQPGVSYTGERDYTNSDYDSTGDANDKWQSNGDNSRNSDAFNQDDYILNDNVDLDEDQNESISSEDLDR